jgi:hypothetical protein
MSHSTESAGSAGAASSRRWLLRDRPILGYGLMLLAAVVLVLNYFIKFPTLPEEAAASFRAYSQRRLPLQIETADAVRLERYFVAEGAPAKVRVLDPATYTLKGGRVQRMLNRKSCWYVYQGPGNTLSVFQMYPGSTTELPAAPEIRRDRGLSFHIYPRQGATAVFWQEKDQCCLLISDASPEEVVRLAQASANN